VFDKQNVTSASDGCRLQLNVTVLGPDSMATTLLDGPFVPVISRTTNDTGHVGGHWLQDEPTTIKATASGAPSRSADAACTTLLIALSIAGSRA
jgi:hypothetical protein